MEPSKNLRSQLGKGIVRAWESLTEGWRELLSRSSGALTHFAAQPKNGEEQEHEFNGGRFTLGDDFKTTFLHEV